MAPTDVWLVLLAGAIVFAGHLVKGISGFGSALFAVPLLLLFLDVRLVAPTFLLFDLTSGALLAGANWRSIDRRLGLLLVSGMLVGTSLGTWLLLSFSHDILRRVLGILVTGWALLSLWGERPEAPSRERPLSTALAPLSGFLGGTLGAMFSVNGPPVIIYLSHVLDQKRVFRATLYGVFFADACYRMALYATSRLLNRDVVRLALLMTPFLVAGVAAGSRLQRFLDQRMFRKIVAAILLVTGVLLLI